MICQKAKEGIAIYLCLCDDLVSYFDGNVIKAACLATKPICVLLFLPVNAFGMGNW
jgi:hypothetical protein